MPKQEQPLKEPSHTDVCLYLDYYGELLGARQQAMMELYYDEDLSLAEIAEETGLTRQGVHDQIRRGVKRLAEWEVVLHLVSRDKKLIATVEEAIALHKKGESEPLLNTLQGLLGMIVPQEVEENKEGTDGDGRI